MTLLASVRLHARRSIPWLGAVAALLLAAGCTTPERRPLASTFGGTTVALVPPSNHCFSDAVRFPKDVLLPGPAVAGGVAEWRAMSIDCAGLLSSRSPAGFVFWAEPQAGVLPPAQAETRAAYAARLGAAIASAPDLTAPDGTLSMPQPGSDRAAFWSSLRTDRRQGASRPAQWCSLAAVTLVNGTPVRVQAQGFCNRAEDQPTKFRPLLEDALSALIAANPG